LTQEAQLPALAPRHLTQAEHNRKSDMDTAHRHQSIGNKTLEEAGRYHAGALSEKPFAEVAAQEFGPARHEHADFAAARSAARSALLTSECRV
jgi:hypothetical protein